MHFSQLRHFLPLSTFPRAQLVELAQSARIEEPADRTLVFDAFSEPLDEVIYLLAGEASAVTTSGIAAIIEGNTPSAAYPLNDGRFRSVTAFSDVVLLYLPFALVDIMTTWDQLAVVERRNTERTGRFFGRGIPRRWRYDFFPVLRTVPPARIEALMQRFEPQTVHEQQVICHQGEPIDDFFIIDSGTALVTRENPVDDGESIELAQLGEGECFGMEALSQVPRSNATVSMIGDGVLMRLPRQDYHTLQQPPGLALLQPAAAIELISDGGHWLDVRQRGEWQNSHLPGAYNLPLHELRQHASRLDPETHYVCYCNSGRRAQAAAHILEQLGFKASVLDSHFRTISGRD
ncbi:rhodanese-like domain-containing protein [Immundisolibacter sp.]|uniref:rhodanese-like domain-containing protein n=1 Tax=Immundisolibacter sp. TaxID=1934948 RepID=UPI000EE48451|nr:hypothetical protein [Gammaproteobacteria bacterium]